MKGGEVCRFSGVATSLQGGRFVRESPWTDQWLKFTLWGKRNIDDGSGDVHRDRAPVGNGCLETMLCSD